MQMMGPGPGMQGLPPQLPPSGAQQQRPLPGQQQPQNQQTNQLNLPNQPNTLFLQGKFPFQMGQSLRAQVFAQNDDQMFTLRFGDKYTQTLSQLPLNVGDFVELKVTGQDKNGTTLTVTRHEAFSQMAEDDLASTLMGMQMPTDEETMNLAKGMVEMGVPLTQQDMQELQQALARLQNPQQSDITSASFLKMAQLPMTPDNISALTNFMMQNPMLGAQLMEFSTAMKRLGDQLANKDLPRDLIELLQKAPGLLGEVALQPKGGGKRKPAQNLHNMAFQAGIERMGPHTGDEDAWDLVRLMRKLRGALAGLSGQIGAEMEEELSSMLKDIEQNFAAQQLINRAEAEKAQGLYYLQIPIRFRNEESTAEVRIQFHRDNKGEPVVDANNTRVEFTVWTERLGQVSYILTVLKGNVEVDATTENDPVRQRLEAFLPELMHRISGLGYTVAGVGCKVSEQNPMTPVIPREEFGEMERVNIRA